MAWRAMRRGDLDAVADLADRIHPDLPEDRAVFAERLPLYPSGCRVLASDAEIAGYALAHPICYPHPPALNTLIGALPPLGDALYIHDVAIAPDMRGGGHAAAAIRALLALGAAFPRCCLISVYGTAPFWRRFGFTDASCDCAPGALAAYGADALWMVRLTPE
ncbi:GNAT family N-acetyltransferase [Jiella sp. MQZ9-1]|nr:GNAT family N-acetyltransferase [Jiella flava]MCD2470206.1 GNAT family N-acetyltransferase [Jiella flava]